jgi:peroxiredoxin
MEKAQLEKIGILNRLSKEFADIETEIRGKSYGDLADHELYIVNHLSVGKAAPEIEGKDLSEIEFKLSDYRGKVVLVLFWGNWSRNSTNLYTQLRSLAKKLEGKPFAIIGVNTDRSRVQIRKTAKLLQLDWRNFWDFRKHGPISTAWSVEQYPAVYVLDDKGIIRFKDVDGTELDAAITSLMSELNYAVDLADHSDGELPTPTLIDEKSPSASDEASGSGSEP